MDWANGEMIALGLGVGFWNVVLLGSFSVGTRLTYTVILSEVEIKKCERWISVYSIYISVYSFKIMSLFNTHYGLSLHRWGNISRDVFLRAPPCSEGTGRIVSYPPTAPAIQPSARARPWQNECLGPLTAQPQHWVCLCNWIDFNLDQVFSVIGYYTTWLLRAEWIQPMWSYYFSDSLFHQQDQFLVFKGS